MTAAEPKTISELGYEGEQLLREIEREARELLGPKYLGQDSESTARTVEDLAIRHVQNAGVLRRAPMDASDSPLSQELPRLPMKSRLIRAAALLLLSTARREVEVIESAVLLHQKQPDHSAGFKGLAMWSCSGEDYVIAESAEAAVSISARGNPGIQPGEGGAPEDWTRLPAERPFKFTTDFGPISRPVGFWVKRFGRGHFASPNV